MNASKVTAKSKRVKELHEQNNKTIYEISVDNMLDFFVRCRDTCNEIFTITGRMELFTKLLCEV